MAITRCSITVIPSMGNAVSGNIRTINGIPKQIPSLINAFMGSECPAKKPGNNTMTKVRG
ncbi:hypothetical protein GCM10025776_12650 [Corallincola platygyrae]